MEGKDLVIVHLPGGIHNPRSAFHKTVHKIVDKSVDETCKRTVTDISHLIAHNLGNELYSIITNSYNYLCVIACLPYSL